jgi:hypothetical protein
MRAATRRYDGGRQTPPWSRRKIVPVIQIPEGLFELTSERRGVSLRIAVVLRRKY